MRSTRVRLARRGLSAAPPDQEGSGRFRRTGKQEEDLLGVLSGLATRAFKFLIIYERCSPPT
jgi:hypothetical protein